MVITTLFMNFHSNRIPNSCIFIFIKNVLIHIAIYPNGLKLRWVIKQDIKIKWPQFDLNRTNVLGSCESL